MLDVDDQLRSHEPHLRYRMTQYEETKRAIEDVEGSVADFARVRPLSACHVFAKEVSVALFLAPALHSRCKQSTADDRSRPQVWVCNPSSTSVPHAAPVLHHLSM